MATPHVAGVAALLAERHPDWTGARLKDALMSSSKPLDATAYALGAGRVDVPAAISAHVTATGSADLGFTSWPYEESEPVTRTVTYTNSSDAPVELSLAVEGMPAGVAALADTALTVPAHGTASTTVTGDGTKAPVGQSSGRITATADGAPVARTALGLVKEEERYTLTVHVKDRDGAPAPASLGVQQLAPGVDPFPAAVGGSGTLELRLKPGTYTVDTFLDVRGSHGPDSLGLGFLTAPEIVLDRDREITLDGRRLREIRAEVDRRTETRQLLMEFDRKANGASYGGAVQVPRPTTRSSPRPRASPPPAPSSTGPSGASASRSWRPPSTAPASPAPPRRPAPPSSKAATASASSTRATAPPARTPAGTSPAGPSSSASRTAPTPSGSPRPPRTRAPRPCSSPTTSPAA